MLWRATAIIINMMTNVMIGYTGGYAVEDVDAQDEGDANNDDDDDTCIAHITMMTIIM